MAGASLSFGNEVAFSKANSSFWRLSLNIQPLLSQRLSFNRKENNVVGRSFRIHCSKDVDSSEDKSVKKALTVLETYFNKLGMNSVDQVQSAAAPTEVPVRIETEDQNLKLDVGTEYEMKKELLLNALKQFDAAEEEQSKMLDNTQKMEEKSSLLDDLPTIRQNGSFVVPFLVVINVGVFIFGLGSSQQLPNNVDLSFLYLAKFNKLILEGQWWRLITPSFVHSGVVPLGLSSWALLTLGTVTEKVYGSTGFWMIYLLGGTAGNLMSFLLTTDATVGGTGPIFSIICSYLVFLIKNRKIVKVANVDVIVLAALTGLLSSSAPLDVWNHMGGAFVGVVFGLVASPTYKDPLIDYEQQQIRLEDSMVAFILCSGMMCCLYFAGLHLLGSPQNS